jgi:ABC-type lipoprotein export system ATPase subunit
VVLVTHDPEIGSRADRIVWLRDGRLDRIDHAPKPTVMETTVQTVEDEDDK